MEKTTDELLKILNSIDSESQLSDFKDELDQSEKTPSFSDYLWGKMQERGFSPGGLWESSKIQRTYGYEILRGDKRPGRDKVLALCLAMGFSYEETQRALKIAEAGALYPRRYRDAIIIFSLEKGLSVIEANWLLDHFSQKILN